MANEIKYNGVAVTGWTSTFNPLKKGPVIGKRIWQTLEDLESYITEPKESAVPGLLVTVINDPNPDNNGAYMITSAAGYEGETKGEWVKLSNGESRSLTLKIEQIQDNDEPVATLNQGILTIKDMRTYWNEQAFVLDNQNG